VTGWSIQPVKTCAIYPQRFSSGGRKTEKELDNPGSSGKQPLKRRRRRK